MVVSSRAIVAVGLGLVGIGALTGTALGQQPQDAAVRQTTGRAAAAAAPSAAVPPTFGTVDMTAVFKGYDKVKVQADEFKAAVMAKQGELMKNRQELQTEADTLAKLSPGSVDFKKHESRMTELKAQIEARREQAERDFAVREAEMLATLYKEIQSMVTRIAQYKKLTYVLRVSNEPVTGADPRSAMTAIERVVVYAENSSDITNDVVFNLNREYKAAGGITPKATSAATAPGTSGARPRGN